MLVCILCLSIINFAIHAGGPVSLMGFLDATKIIPASCASRVSSPAMRDLRTAGEQRHSSMIVVRKVRRHMENMAKPLCG